MFDLKYINRIIKAEKMIEDFNRDKYSRDLVAHFTRNRELKEVMKNEVVLDLHSSVAEEFMNRTRVKN